MVKYHKLVLEGFGCFLQRTEFSFSDGLNTLSLPNEAGKSTMLNGLVHTLYGMDKKAKDRFMPWQGSQVSKGELTLESRGRQFIVGMDFIGRTVQVKEADPITGAINVIIKSQSHIPGGRPSSAYSKFILDALGTASIESFKSAFIIEQPIKSEFSLGAGRNLLIEQGGVSLEKTIKALLDKLGKKEEGITSELNDYDVESSNQHKKRQLEKVQDQIAEIRAKLQDAKRRIDGIQPAKEKLDEERDKLQAAKEKLRKAGDRGKLVRRWLDLRLDYITKRDAAAIAEQYLKQVEMESEKLRAAELELDGLTKLNVGRVYDQAALESLEKAILGVEGLLRESEPISSMAGTGEDLIGPDLLCPDAEGMLSQIAGKARAEAEAIRKGIDEADAWDREYSEVAGMDDKERTQIDESIAQSCARKDRRVNSWRIAAFTMLALAGFGAFAIWASSGVAWLMAAGFVLLAAAALGLWAALSCKAHLNAQQLAELDEKIGKMRIRAGLYDKMRTNPRPQASKAESMKADDLLEMASHADKLSRIAFQVKARLEAVSSDAVLASSDLGSDARISNPAGLIGLGDGFWLGIKNENSMRADNAKRIEAMKNACLTAKEVANKMLSAKGFASIGEMQEDVARKKGDSGASYFLWDKEFGLHVSLKPDLERTALEAAQEELDRADADALEAEGDMEFHKEQIEKLQDSLRQSDADSIPNIPELESQLENLTQLRSELKLEASALGYAIRTLRETNTNYGEEARRSLKSVATSLLEEITDVKQRAVLVDEGFSLVVEVQGTEIAAEQLSQGTKDQLYISMRMAAAEILEDGRMVPIFLDDSFGTTDSRRLAKIRGLLTKMSAERQFIVLSHSDDILGWGNAIGIT